MNVNSSELLKAAVDFVNKTGEPFVNVDAELGNAAIRITIATFQNKKELKDEPYIETLKQQLNSTVTGLLTLKMMRTDDEILGELVDDILHDVAVIKKESMAKRVKEID